MDSWLRLFFLAGTALFTVSVVWLNFNGAQFYNWDMYSDAYAARMMAESKSLFPPAWVFGNQYYVIATPAVAALLYGLCGDMISSMAGASSLYMLAILGAFAWCIKPYCNRESAAAGLFCMSGALILGYSASTCTSGLQVFYSMASYYACYVLGILLTLGIYIRLEQHGHVNKILAAIVLLMNGALGMQSVRELLVLNLPLLALEALALVRRERNKKRSCFCLCAFISNIIGIAVMGQLPIKSSSNTAEVSLCSSLGELLENVKSSSSALASMCGLDYISYGWKWKPLFLLALFITGAVAVVIVGAIRKSDSSPLRRMICFCGISLLAVYTVGVLLFRIRPIYFFVWVLLAAFCFTYFAEKMPDGWLKRSVLVLLLLCGAVNYFYNFYPDLKKSGQYKASYSALAERLAEDGVERVFVDPVTAPTVAACSHDRLSAGRINYDFDAEGEALLKAVPNLKDERLYENLNEHKSILIMSDPNYDELSSVEYIETFGSGGYLEKLMPNLELMSIEDQGETTLYLYRILRPDIISQ